MVDFDRSKSLRKSRFRADIKIYEWQFSDLHLADLNRRYTGILYTFNPGRSSERFPLPVDCR